MIHDLVALRRHLHAHPERSGHEAQTSRLVRDHLGALGYTDLLHGFAQHSVLAVLTTGRPGPTLLFRCELDALPIQELNRFAHRSQTADVSHKCGHDGHMAILLGLARRLQEAPPACGQVLLLFQSAEETGQGARAVIDSGVLRAYPIAYAFALHNLPGYPLGEVVSKTGRLTPSVESVCIHLQGRTSHAGEPDQGINPALVVADLIQYFATLHCPVPTDDAYFVSTPIHLSMGEEAYGISAGAAQLGYTFRTWDNARFDRMKATIEAEIGRRVQQQPGLQVHWEWKEAFRATVNDPDADALIRTVADGLGVPFHQQNTPFAWGEDFGLFTERYRGALFGLGAGPDCPVLHSPDYDFPDALLDRGVGLFEGLVRAMLGS
ncbi:amidohydrolase [Catalinimonas alkaloidigena]|uniref:Amidohydrolase n=1 Tax=Catalinimonas alkaloidigena TaxID=1075417 RepID=A0A1G9SI34_9BACT|nr:amidohydrolase [Catalinimonas alkaloidigena]SDM35168.1 amidohydrolase [Catalinimonas alkaloidigena]